MLVIVDRPGYYSFEKDLVTDVSTASAAVIVGDWAIEIDTSLAREKGCAKRGSFLLKCVIYISNKIFKISDLP